MSLELTKELLEQLKMKYTIDNLDHLNITGFAGHVERTYNTIKRGRVRIG